MPTATASAARSVADELDGIVRVAQEHASQLPSGASRYIRQGEALAKKIRDFADSPDPSPASSFATDTVTPEDAGETVVFEGEVPLGVQVNGSWQATGTANVLVTV